MLILVVIMFFFFFKQKTAYEIRLSLVGSEMCIRDTTIGQMIAKGGFPAFYLPPVSIALMYENKRAVSDDSDNGATG